MELWPRQMQALNTQATELLFGGATEGGKSHFVRVALITWCLMIDGLQCVLLRKNFDDVVKNHIEGPTGFRNLLEPLVNCGLAKITQTEVRFTQTGALISLEHCNDERKLTSAQGVEKHVLVVDEATQIPERILRFVRTWVRMPIEMQKSLPDEFKYQDEEGKERYMFPRIVYTANPIGASVGFFRRTFVKARGAFAIEKVEGFLRQYIPSRAQDNPSVDMEAHLGRLSGFGDAATAKALDEGDWDAPLGDFIREYNDSLHAVPNFIPPDHWARFRTFDWGTAEPAVCYWWAISDGQPFEDHTGAKRWYPRGAEIIYREWYACDPEKPAEGLRLRNEDMARKIVEMSPDECEKRLVTLTDSLPFQDRGGETIAMVFAKNGCPLTLGDTSRIAGWSQLKSALIGQKIDSNDEAPTPMFYLVESCKYARDYLPALPRHATKMEDAVESGESTHACDAIRLGCMAKTRVIEKSPAPLNTRDLKQQITMNEALKIVQRHKAKQHGASW